MMTAFAPRRGCRGSLGRRIALCPSPSKCTTWRNSSSAHAQSPVVPPPQFPARFRGTLVASSNTVEPAFNWPIGVRSPVVVHGDVDQPERAHYDSVPRWHHRPSHAALWGRPDGRVCESPSCGGASRRRPSAGGAACVAGCARAIRLGSPCGDLDRRLRSSRRVSRRGDRRADALGRRNAGAIRRRRGHFGPACAGKASAYARASPGGTSWTTSSEIIVGDELGAPHEIVP